MHIAHKGAPLLIDRRYPGRAIQHQRPLRSYMPVQLANTAGDQPHLHSSHRLRDRQIAHRYLPRPSTRLNPLMRQRERILERLLAARIRRRRPHRIRVLIIQHRIRRRPRLALVDPGMRISRINFALLSLRYLHTSCRDQHSRARLKKLASA